MCSLLKAPNLEPGDNEDTLCSNDVEDIDSELLIWLYLVAVKVNNDIKSAPGYNCIGNINEKSAEEVVPETLIMLMLHVMCWGQGQ